MLASCIFMTLLHRQIAVFWGILAFFVSVSAFFPCLAASGDVVPKQAVAQNPHSAMLAESALYLQKAVAQFETTPDSQKIAVRVAPIVTVTRGLLDAGVSPDEPLLQSGLRFLQRFYDDQKKLGEQATVSDGLLAKIETCLAKAKQNAPANESFQRQNLPDNNDFLRNSLTLLDDSEAGSRAMGFVQQLDVFDAELNTAVIAIDETQYVLSPGLGHSMRFRDLYQALAEREALPLAEHFSPVQWEDLIASVHGLPNYPPLPDGPRFPKHETHFAALPQLTRSNDHRKKSGNEQVLTCFLATNYSLDNAFEPQQSALRRHLLADNLAALQTVRRLE